MWTSQSFQEYLRCQREGEGMLVNLWEAVASVSGCGLGVPLVSRADSQKGELCVEWGRVRKTWTQQHALVCLAAATRILRERGKLLHFHLVQFLQIPLWSL